MTNKPEVQVLREIIDDIMKRSTHDLREARDPDYRQMASISFSLAVIAKGYLYQMAEKQVEWDRAMKEAAEDE